MKRALQALVAGAVDYAGLFPPASLDMPAAVESYARYLRDTQSAMLGRFVAPVVRLREFDEAAASLLPRGQDSQPWRLSALSGPDLGADIDLALRFNSRHEADSEIGHAVIDALEVKVAARDEIFAASSIAPPQFATFFEIPIGEDPAALIAAIARAGAFAKARTGGVTPTAFPTAADVARFMMCCRDARVAFKLTAGLHHPLRAQYRLTYAPDAPRGVMFGYLNMFVAATLAWSGAGESLVTDCLLATDARDFEFRDDAVTFRGTTIPTQVVADSRANFIISFGSCSFREPVDELAELPVN